MQEGSIYAVCVDQIIDGDVIYPKVIVSAILAIGLHVDAIRETIRVKDARRNPDGFDLAEVYSEMNEIIFVEFAIRMDVLVEGDLKIRAIVGDIRIAYGPGTQVDPSAVLKVIHHFCDDV